MKRLFIKRWLLLLVGLLLALTLGPYWIQQARAQGPECPPGFFWRRMSGVGCMQEGCLDIANAKYSYTGACICIEGYKGCYEPVDYTAFDGSKCGPFCPNSTLIACVEPDAPCPGEEAASPGEEAVEPVGPPSKGEEPSAPKEEPASSPGEEAVEPVAPAIEGEKPTSPLAVSDLVRDLEQFLAGEGVKGPTPGQAAAGAAAVSALIGAWVLVNLLSGADPQAVLAAVQKWRLKGGTAPQPSTTSAPPKPRYAGPIVDKIKDGERAKRLLKDLKVLQKIEALDPNDPDYWENLDKIIDQAKDSDRRVKAIAYTHKTDSKGHKVPGIVEDSLVIVVEEPEYGPYTPPPTPPVSKKAPPTPRPPEKVPPAPPKPPGIDTIYNADPNKFRQCQDLVYGRLWNEPPPTGSQDKAKIYAKMVEEGYWLAEQGGKYDLKDAMSKLASARDGDIIMFDRHGLPDEHRAAHYAIVENGKIYQILNLPKGGEPEIIDLKDASLLFKPRQVRSLANGKLHPSGGYYGFKIYRKPPT